MVLDFSGRQQGIFCGKSTGGVLGAREIVRVLGVYIAIGGSDS